MVKETVVVTGGAGFIGAHLVELLLKKKFKVVVIDIQKSCKSYFFEKHLEKKVSYRNVDIRKKKQVTAFFSLIHPTYVIHLAAQPIVQDAYDNPYDAFETNIMGTVNILEACRKDKNIKRILIASSDKAYGKTKVAYTETSPLQGDHPYDVSKSCADLIAQTFFKTYGLPVVITRFGNVYGEGDMHFDRIIPGICQSIIVGKPLQLRSDGTYIRDYLYVKDVALGYMKLIEIKKDITGEAYNFSSDDTCSVLELIKKAEKTLKKHIAYDIQNTAKNEIPYQHLEDRKIRRLGWKSKYNINKKIVQVFRWYQEYFKRE
ncbi:MAG: SDR family NAD(P)-dependent oxidoreductase [Microgenomates group bacterium]